MSRTNGDTTGEGKKAGGKEISLGKLKIKGGKSREANLLEFVELFKGYFSCLTLALFENRVFFHEQLLSLLNFSFYANNSCFLNI